MEEEKQQKASTSETEEEPLDKDESLNLQFNRDHPLKLNSK